MESVLLTSIGTMLGLGLAWAALSSVNHFTAQLLPNALPIAIDARILGYTAAIAAIMAGFIGLVPAVPVFGDSLISLLHSQSRGASGGRSVRAVNSGLVTVQIGVALVLLAAAGLLIHSFANVLAVNPGFDARQVVAARIALSVDYRDEPRRLGFQRQLLTGLEQVPGFERIALATATPFQGGMPVNGFVIRDYKLPPNAPQPGAFHLGASPAYLGALHIPLREGRWFNESDTEKSRRVYVVDQDFADRYFAGRSAVGQHMTFGNPPAKEEDWPEIIGVVGKVRQLGVEENSGNSYIYHPLTQTPFGAVSVLIRTSRPVPEAVALLREKMAAIDPGLPVFQAATMESVISDSFSNRRAIVWLIGTFAGIALLLSAVGIYGVLAYEVSQRTREIGIRTALGATHEGVVKLILKVGLWRILTGLAIGLTGAMLLRRFITALLFGLTPTDPVAYIAMAIVLLAVALFATWLPARRAARIDPIMALRTE